MMVNDHEHNLILAALRLVSMAYQERAEQEHRRFNNIEASKYAAFSIACGDLSNRLEGVKPAGSRILRPH